MALVIDHKFKSQKADGTDESLIRPSNWNDTHNISIAGFRLVGKATANQGPATEISLGTGLEFLGSALRLIQDQTFRNITGTGTATFGGATAFNHSVTIRNSGNNGDLVLGSATIRGDVSGNLWHRVGTTNHRIYTSDNLAAFMLNSQQVVPVAGRKVFRVSGSAITDGNSWVNTALTVESPGSADAYMSFHIPGITTAKNLGMGGGGQLFWGGNGSPAYEVITSNNLGRYIATMDRQAIGSYVMGMITSGVYTTTEFGQIVVGSNIRAAGVGGSNPTSTAHMAGTGEFPGSWMAMGWNRSEYTRVTLFKRIA